MRLALLISLLASLLSVESFLKPRPQSIRQATSHLFYGTRRNHIATSCLYVTSSPSMEIAEEVSRCELYVQRMRTLGRGRSFGPILGNIIRYLNQFCTCVLFSVLLRVFNRVKVHDRDRLDNLVLENRADSRPLLSVSNHQSLLDDPGLWAAILPWWRMSPESVRWGVCTEDVFFAVPWLQPFMGAGNVLPLDRGGSLFQPSFKFFQEKLNHGAWCHVFPEGRIWQDWRFEKNDEHLGPFKVGVGKLIAHCQNDPLILPMVHTGMDKIVPEKPLKKGSRKASRPISKWPQLGNKVDVYVGEPFSLRKEVEAFRGKHPGVLESFDNHSPELLQFYSDLADAVKEKVVEIEQRVRHTR